MTHIVIQDYLEAPENELSAEESALQIIQALVDPDTGVAATAKRNLELAATTTPGESFAIPFLNVKQFRHKAYTRPMVNLPHYMVQNGRIRPFVATHAFSAGLSIILGSGCRDAISTLIRSQDPTVKLRALSLVTTLASANPEAAAQIRSTGNCTVA